jgi:nitrite reductase/ring-hydroxylating ferredoxin subunit
VSAGHGAAASQASGAHGDHEPDLLERAQELIAGLEAHPDPDVRVRVTELLQAIDTVHRTALSRLVHALRAMGGDAFLNRLVADPAIRLLLMSYDLLAVDRRLLAEEALDPVRGHLHARGIDVVLADVVGGAVYARLHGLERSGVPADAVRRDLEAALAAGLVGFQQLVLGDRSGESPALLQVGGLRPARRPVYRRVCGEHEVRPGAVMARDVDGERVLLARVDGEVRAVADRCGESPLPLHLGALEGAVVRCSWHGCRYDLRTGHRLDGDGARLPVFPVLVQDGAVLVAVTTDPVATDDPRAADGPAGTRDAVAGSDPGEAGPARAEG